VLDGPNVARAEIHFTNALNVIVGPSDTGKTFIAQCIDFVLGSGVQPKEIPEANGYDSIILTITSNDSSEEFVLTRSRRGGDVRLSTNGKADRILSARHHGEGEASVSSFLLRLSGLEGKRVRMNQQGKTRSLSFRDIAPLVLVDEESIIASTSPVLSGQYTTRTVEGGVFRLLLTGTDDSSVIARVDPKIAKGRHEGRAELLEDLLRQARAELVSLDVSANIPELQVQFVGLQSAVEDARVELETEQGSAAAVEERRREAWTQLRQVESRADALSQLQERFVLLKEQYSSDLRRLDAITEAGFRLGQMTEERCPVCGALAEHHDSAHQDGNAAPADVANACRAEASKTANLLQDLATTLRTNAEEVERLDEAEIEWRREMAGTNAELKTLLQPRLQQAVQKLRDSESRRDACGRALKLSERSLELEAMLADARKPQKTERADGPSSVVSTGDADEFSQEVETLLRAWHFPNLARVTFSENDQDLIISGRARASHGKGVRAITRAAFNLGLLRLCDRTKRPFPGFVLLDSPLVVYREPDVGESEFPHEVKDSFYRSIASHFQDSQVIILENDEPPADVLTRANCVSFTGTAQGRRGLIPSQ
jgi:hypothetical protein